MTNKTNKVVHQVNKTAKLYLNIKQLLDEVEQNIVICQWQTDQLFAEAEG